MQLTTVQNNMPMNNFNFAAMAEVNNNVRMGTREIADMLGSQHSNVKISVERLIKSGAVDALAVREREFKTERGNTYIEYMLDQESSITLVAQLDPTFCNAIVKRWRELEHKVKNPFADMNFNADQAVFVAQLAIVNAKAVKQVEQQQKLLIESKPKVEFFDDYVSRDGRQLATDVAKTMKMTVVDFNKTLDAIGGIYFKNTKHRRFMHWFIEAGYGEMKQNKEFAPTPVFTNAGVEYVIEQIKAFKKAN
ncbi:phage antirepressor KilAC domain-containing protein [Aeromonas salmonicida]|uniref:phage antirepressor KilAC domain-containing protein n=1 Tax=Aeromonas salmonicida TaxID=645 RepID=UPI003D31B765